MNFNHLDEGKWMVKSIFSFEHLEYPKIYFSSTFYPDPLSNSSEPFFLSSTYFMRSRTSSPPKLLPRGRCVTLPNEVIDWPFLTRACSIVELVPVPDTWIESNLTGIIVVGQDKHLGNLFHQNQFSLCSMQQPWVTMATPPLVRTESQLEEQREWVKQRTVFVCAYVFILRTNLI